MTEVYDEIGVGYRNFRVPDPRIQTQITASLAGAKSVVNVGAGTGSYEPLDRPTVAVEPSPTMISQRHAGLNPVVRAYAEALPFANDSFDTALALLTVHHWPDRRAGLQELQRVARHSVVLFTHDGFHDSFWLMDYFPEILEVDERIMPSNSELETIFPTLEEVRVPIPADCSDGFLAAYWRRPESYLDPGVRQAISAFAMIEYVDEGLERLSHDLQSGAWHDNYGEILNADSLDLGYKLVIARVS